MGMGEVVMDVMSRGFVLVDGKYGKYATDHLLEFQAVVPELSRSTASDVHALKFALQDEKIIR